MASYCLKCSKNGRRKCDGCNRCPRCDGIRLRKDDTLGRTCDRCKRYFELLDQDRSDEARELIQACHHPETRRHR